MVRSQQQQLAAWNPARDAWETQTTGMFCEHSDVYSETWPTSGMTRGGTAYALPTWEQRTAGSVFSSSRLLATPTAAISKGGRPQDSRGKRDLRLDLLPTATRSELLPTPRAAAGGSATETVALPLADYRDAIARAEQAVGRAAPEALEPGRNGGPRLSPRFVEWLMMLPDGWVTDVPGLSRAEQLRALGNGVVPAQGRRGLARVPRRRGVARGPVPDWARVLNVVGEAGEFAEAYRRYTGHARRTGSIQEVAEELADVVISAATCAAQLGIDLDEAVRAKRQIVLSRGFGGAS